MSSIDPTVERHLELTDAHRALIADHNLHVTFEFGHVCIMNALAVERLGKASGNRRMKLVGTNDATEGRVHDEAQHFDEMLESMVDIAKLANRANPSFAESHPGQRLSDELAAEQGIEQPKREPKVLAAKAPKRAAGGRKAIVVDMEAENEDGSTEHVAEIVKVVAQGAPKVGGVIAALVTLLSDGNKRTRAQLYDALALQFPDRASAEGGMRVTIGVQLNALKGKGHKIQCNADKQYWI